MKKIIVTRTSVLPNKFNSFCYIVAAASVASLAGLSGLYKTDDGVTLLYSPACIGSLNKPSNVQYREQRSGDRLFVNLIDPRAEMAGELGSAVSLATKAGFGAAGQTQAASIFFGKWTTPQANQASVATAPATEIPTETPAPEEHVNANADLVNTILPV